MDEREQELVILYCEICLLLLKQAESVSLYVITGTHFVL